MAVLAGGHLAAAAYSSSLEDTPASSTSKKPHGNTAGNQPAELFEMPEPIPYAGEIHEGEPVLNAPHGTLLLGFLFLLQDSPDVTLAVENPDDSYCLALHHKIQTDGLKPWDWPRAKILEFWIA
ncbi:MAG TPA: hypothetical protein VHW09_10550 [Bryobacteraceae bacterium]|nr:hypothetical protein [Bryobacteraceae bacterium]